MKRYVTEMGMGVDVHGGDYTKAACRAVSDAIRHSSLNFFPHIDKDRDSMKIVLKVGAGNPDLIDADRVAAELPYGAVTVEAELGGLDVPAENGTDLMVIVNVAVLVGFED
ncbi:MAG: hypothetical protein ACI8P9_002559 [Parasphingorhabdus sp.]|jgi:uncharacterized protein (TIGR02058 family)